VSEANSKQVTYRCPVCFSRENDVVLQKDAKGKYYCVKCSFYGTQDKINEMYGDLKKKYNFILTRLSLDDIDKI
jgi:hypothetical protein